jgi:hypothetical protein
LGPKDKPKLSLNRCRVPRGTINIRQTQFPGKEAYFHNSPRKRAGELFLRTETVLPMKRLQAHENIFPKKHRIIHFKNRGKKELPKLPGN